MARKLYFTRHGQSLWNVANKICGQTDIELTDFGLIQAEQTGKLILEKKIKIDEILTSPLKRASQTAFQIGKVLNVPVKIEDALIEQHLGKWEGSPRNSEEYKIARCAVALNNESGESILKVCQRIYNLLDRLKNDGSNKNYLLVSHNGISRAVNSYFYDMTNEELGSFKIKNCEIIEYEFD